MPSLVNLAEGGWRPLGDQGHLGLPLSSWHHIKLLSLLHLNYSPPMSLALTAFALFAVSLKILPLVLLPQVSFFSLFILQTVVRLIFLEFRFDDITPPPKTLQWFIVIVAITHFFTKTAEVLSSALSVMWPLDPASVPGMGLD